MKKFLFLLLAVTAGTAPAQTLVYPGEHEMPPVPKTFDNELGVRYGAQLYVGDGRGPELQAFSIDYARYNFYNIGFRTGLNVFVDEDAENYFSVPLQFTWRTGAGRAGSGVCRIITTTALMQILTALIPAEGRTWAVRFSTCCLRSCPRGSRSMRALPRG